MLLKVIYYSVSILSIFLFVSSVQFKEKKNILLVQTFASMSYFIVYYILGAFSGCAIELIEQTKDIVFYFFEKKKVSIPLILLVIFVTLLITASIITYDGLYSLLPLIINLSHFISSYLKNPKYIRVVMLICGFIWLIYNIIIGAYIIIIGNVLEIISATISLIRYKEDKKEIKKQVLAN